MCFIRCLIWMFVWPIATVGAYKNGCSGGYCFVIPDIQNNTEMLDQSTVQQLCRSNGTQLVEIRNQEIHNALVNFISSQGLNGYRPTVLTNGKRTLDSTWHRLSGIYTGGLTILEQTDSSYAYGYLKSTTSGFDLYASRPADSKGGFICAGLSDCSCGLTIRGLCYKSLTHTLSWYDARNRCLDGGGDLASFDHITSNDGFKTLNGSWISLSNSYWIGIRKEWWTWQGSMSDVTYSDWMTGHPINYQTNTDCLCLSTNSWMWTECGCSQQLPFVCISVSESTTPSTTMTSTKTTATFTTTRPSISSTTFTTTTSTSAFKAVSLGASENDGLSTPTVPVPATVTSNSSPTANDTVNLEQPMKHTEVGLAVGLGIGIPLIIVIVTLAVIIAKLKKQKKQLRQALLSCKNGIRQPASTDLRELNVVTEDQYEKLRPRIERSATSDGPYQNLHRSNRTDGSVPSSNI